MNLKAAIFDLDGTLADTLADIAQAANHARTSLGLSSTELPEYRYLAGQGVHRLFFDALSDQQQDLVPELVERFRAFYADHRFDHTTLYPGIADMLSGLVEQEITLAVLSNKPDPATKEVADHLLKDWPFAVVRGARDDTPLKPEPGAGQAILADLGLPASDCAYVGDTRVDMLTGKGAGMFTVGVTWGFRDEDELRESGADAIIHHPMELLDAMDGVESGTH